MDLALQVNFINKPIRNDTMFDLEEFSNQSLATQAKKTRTINFNDACFLKNLFTTGR